MSERPTPETERIKGALHTSWIDLLNHARKLERERDEAREQLKEWSGWCVEYMTERDKARKALEEENKFHHRTHSELVQTQCKLMDAMQAIIATLEENRHLADGDDCTLAKLKSVVPDWE